MEEKIEYRNIKDWPKYQVSNTGVVISNKAYKNGEPLSQVINDWGYFYVCLHNEGKQKIFRVHRLVIETFIGPCPEGMECCHLDGNPQNNNIKNLEWNTHTVNMEHRTAHGRNYGAIGESNCKNKLTEIQVLEIIARQEAGERDCDLAIEYEVTHQAIYAIKVGKNWKHLRVKN